MKKFNFLATILAAFFFVACTSNDIPGETDENSSQGDRVLKISIETLGTKAEHPGAADGSFTKVEDGVIYFFKDGGNAVYAYRLTANDITTLATANNPTLKDITVTGVPLTANHVVLITNLNRANKTYPSFAGNTLNTIKGFTFEIKEQQPVGDKTTQSPTAEVIMSGEGEIVVNNNENKATIVIAPVLSRLEVGSVRCKNMPGTSLPQTFGDGQITKFRIRGVFITNHYENGTVFGTGQNATYKSSDPAVYNAAFQNGLVDFFNAPNTLTKESSNYFAYHTFPSVNTTDMPNIVIAVDNIWFKDIDGTEKSWKNGNVQFFTVEKFRNGADYLTKFDPAKVYRILGTDPSTETIYEGKNNNGEIIKDKNGDPVIFDNTGKPIGNPIGSDGQPIPSISINNLIPITITLPGGSGGIEFGIDDLTDKPYDKNKTVICNITIMPWSVVNITPSK